MNAEPRIGFGLVVALTLCSIRPIALSVIGSCASAVWADGGPLLTELGVLLVMIGISMLVPRRFRARANQEEHT
jgi:hypothetical protein